MHQLLCNDTLTAPVNPLSITYLIMAMSNVQGVQVGSSITLCAAVMANYWPITDTGAWKVSYQGAVAP